MSTRRFAACTASLVGAVLGLWLLLRLDEPINTLNRVASQGRHMHDPRAVSGGQPSRAGLAAAAPAPAGLAAAPPIPMEALRLLGEGPPVMVSLHPSWCAVDEGLPFRPFGQVDSYALDVDGGLAEVLFRPLLAKTQFAQFRTILAVTVDCQLVVPVRDWDSRAMICLARHNARHRCARAPDIGWEAPRWPVERLPTEVMNAPCWLSVRSLDFGDVPGADDLDALPVSWVSVGGVRVPLPRWLPEGMCKPLLRAGLVDDPSVHALGVSPVAFAPVGASVTEP